MFCFLFFFFQAEDGIRDSSVTGVRRVLFRSGTWHRARSRAVESYRRVIELDAKFPGIHLELGKVYISERDSQEAVRELKTVLETDPDNPEANYFLGGFLVQEGHPLDGLPYLEKACELIPDSWAAFFYRGKALVE